ncbi:MAG: hypothetical protein Kow00122_08300 [Thermoleophilia bacterium]
MFANVFSAQQIKSLRNPVLWIELLLVAGVAALVTVLLNTVGDLAEDRSGSAAGQVIDMVKTMSGLGAALAVVLAGALMAQEYSWRSLHLWLSMGVSRRTFLWTKFLSLLVPMALFFVTAATITAAFAFALMNDVPATFAGWEGELALALGAGLYSLLPYAALAVFLAVLGRSMLVAVGGGLGLTLIAENLFVQLANLIGGGAVEVIRYLPSMLSQGLLESDASLVEPLGSGASAGLIGLYTLVLLAAATYLLRRQDLSD